HEPTLEIQALVGLAQALRETSEIQSQDALERREDLLPRPLLELEAAAGGAVRKGAVTQCPLQLRTGDPQQRRVAEIEAEGFVLLTDEVEDGERVLVGRTPQPAADLLDEDRGALGGAQQQERVHRGHVDALVEEVDDAQHAGAVLRLPGEGAQEGFALFSARAARQRLTTDRKLRTQNAGHELCVRN